MNWKILHVGAWAGISLLCWSSLSWAAPWQQLRTVGQGEMHWLWFKLYEATLYSQDGRYVARRYPQALSLTYARDIDKQDILDATGQEWQRLGLGDERQQVRWLGALSNILPDVNKGDRLTFYVNKQGLGELWLRDAPLGLITEPGFPDAFLAIWLADNSRDPALTRRLRGQP
ncbi:MAG: chalcone isomerase family protein [Aeromonas molluscorum]